MSRAVWYNISIPWMIEFSEYSIIIIIIIRYGALPHYTFKKYSQRSSSRCVIWGKRRDQTYVSLAYVSLVVSEWFMGTQQLSRVVYVLPEGY